MNSKPAKPNLRDRQAAATREAILDAGMKLLTRGGGNFSHESIATDAGMGARTVYRHFPDRSELLQALWMRLRDQTDIKFPTREQEVASFLRAVFRSFDEHESLVRAILNSSAGMEVRDRGGVEGRAAFARSLSSALLGLRSSERARIIAVFVAIYSAPFWQLLRDRGELNGSDARDAAAWLVEILLDALHKAKKGKSNGKIDRKRKPVRSSGH